MASLIRYPLPYYAPTPVQTAARFERLRQHGRSREKTRLAAIERAEPHALHALRRSASTAQVVRASSEECATDTGILFTQAACKCSPRRPPSTGARPTQAASSSCH